MEKDGKQRRLRERLKLALPVRVTCRESSVTEWAEVTRLIEVTPFGASFTISHSIDTGRILHLSLPMPRQLRCFDHIEDQYKVWGLVRHVEPRMGSPEKGKTPELRYEVGVAFIGKNPPESYKRDPCTVYEVTNRATATSMWTVQEKPRAAPEGSRTQRSKGTRLQMAVTIKLELFDDQGVVQASEQTVTENLSRRGAAVLTTLDIDRGQFVRVTSVDQNLAVMAVVRARRLGLDGIPRLHLEFFDTQWPLEGIEAE